MFSEEEIQLALDQIRPALQADGGDVELIEVQDDGVVVVQLQGACKGCPMSQLTLSNGVERILRERVSDDIRVKSADMPEDFNLEEFFNAFPGLEEDEESEN